MRKLEERLECVCVCNKEYVAGNTIREGTQRGSQSSYQTVCASVCVCVFVSVCGYKYTNADVDALSLQGSPSTAPSLYCSVSQSDFVYRLRACMFFSKHKCARIKRKKAPSSGQSPDPKQNQSRMWMVCVHVHVCMCVCVCVYV